MAPEPILCFDGDAAGERAAGRAAERALPLLEPGKSLRFATLPAGEDPDTLILKFGPMAMRKILDGALPLKEIVWTIERRAHSLDTPEQRALLEKRLRERAAQIPDRQLRWNYQQFLMERLREVTSPHAARRRSRPGGPGRLLSPFYGAESSLKGHDPASVLPRRQQEVLLATLLNHPSLLHAFAEDLAALDFAAPDLDKLRHALLNTVEVRPDLDAEALRLHLCSTGFARTVDGLLSPQVYLHAAFARPDADPEAARAGWVHVRNLYFEDRQLEAEIDAVQRDLARDMTAEKEARMRALQERRKVLQSHQVEEEQQNVPGGLAR
jgi:DNA primase